MRKLFTILTVAAVTIGLNFGVLGSSSANNCQGVNKEGTDKSNVIQEKYIYLDSCNATKAAVHVAQQSSNSTFMNGLITMIPGFQPIGVVGLLSSKLMADRGNLITLANAEGTGVKIKMEKDLGHKDTSHLWLFKGIVSQ